MEIADMIVLVLLMILAVTLLILAENNRRLSKENRLLREFINSSREAADMADMAEQTLHKSSHESETDVNSMTDKEKIIALSRKGRSAEEIAGEVHMPIDMIEMIIKFDRIKKEHGAS